MALLDIARDPLWQSILALVAILVAIIIPLWVYKQQRNIKLLVYDISDPIPLFSVHESIRTQITVLLNNQKVEAAYTVSINFSNKRTLPITKHDYDENLRISFTDSGKLVGLDLSDKHPDGLLPEIANIDMHSVKYQPFLLNPGDRFTIRAYVYNGSIRVNVSSRIIGGNVISINEFDNRFFEFDNRLFRVLVKRGHFLLRMALVFFLVFAGVLLSLLFSTYYRN